MIRLKDRGDHFHKILIGILISYYNSTIICNGKENIVIFLRILHEVSNISVTKNRVIFQ